MRVLRLTPNYIPELTRRHPPPADADARGAGALHSVRAQQRHPNATRSSTRSSTRHHFGGVHFSVRRRLSVHG